MTNEERTEQLLLAIETLQTFAVPDRLRVPIATMTVEAIHAAVAEETEECAKIADEQDALYGYDASVQHVANCIRERLKPG